MVIRIIVVVAGINVVDQQEAGPDDGGDGQPRGAGSHHDDNLSLKIVVVLTRLNSNGAQDESTASGFTFAVKNPTHSK